MKRLIATMCVLALVTLSLPALGEDWPQWRGPGRDGKSAETGLMQSWPDGGPKQVWMVDTVGLGYSSFAVVGDTLYTMGERDGGEMLIAIDVKDGSEKWATKMGGEYGNRWGGGPRGTPTVEGDFVYALGANGDLVCARAGSGEIVWQRKMSEFGGKRPGWGYTESVLVDGEKVVCTPGGNEGAMVALNKKDGKLIWQSEGFTQGAQYSSIIAADHLGDRHYIQLTMKELAGINAKNGKVLWRSDWPGRTAVIPTPIFHDGFVFISSGYNVGCKLVKVTATGASDVYQNKDFDNHHGGVILLDGHLYGHSNSNGWICQEFKTGDIKWQEKRVLGKGCLTYADKRFYCQGEGDGRVVLAELTPEGWKEHGKFTLQPQSQKRSRSGAIWTHPVIANGKMYLRDQELLFCFSVSSPAE